MREELEHQLDQEYPTLDDNDTNNDEYKMLSEPMTLRWRPIEQDQ